MWGNSVQRLPRRAFTLVELLVVIGIIGLLMSILLPAIAKSRQQAIRVQCASNLRQWGLAIQQYANENRNYFPYNGPAMPPGIPVGGQDLSWNSSVVQQFFQDYLIKNTTLSQRAHENILFCPTQTWHREEQNDATLTGGLVGYFYLPHRDPKTSTMDYTPAGNEWVAKKKLSGLYKLAPIASDMQQYNSGTKSWARYSGHVRNNKPLGGNFLFEDGHVVWHDFSEIDVGATTGGWICNYKIAI